MDKDEVQEIRMLFLDNIDQLQEYFAKNLFTNYTPSPNILKVFGSEIKGIDDALEFLLYHEGFHTGYILSLKRLVS